METLVGFLFGTAVMAGGYFQEPNQANQRNVGTGIASQGPRSTQNAEVVHARLIALLKNSGYTPKPFSPSGNVFTQGANVDEFIKSYNTYTRQILPLGNTIGYLIRIPATGINGGLSVVCIPHNDGSFGLRAPVLTVRNHRGTKNDGLLGLIENSASYYPAFLTFDLYEDLICMEQRVEVGGPDGSTMRGHIEAFSRRCEKMVKAFRDANGKNSR